MLFSCFNTGVEESVNVDDVLEESPLLFGVGLSVDSTGGCDGEGDNDLLDHFKRILVLIIIRKIISAKLTIY